MSKRWMIFPFFVCLFAAGCGLADYEKRIDDQAKRLKDIDENNKYLGAAITNDSAWPFTVCLRLPKDFKTAAEEKPLTNQDLKLHVFQSKKGDGQNIYVAAAGIGDKDKDGKFKEGELSVDEFRKRIRQALADEHRLVDFFGPKTESKNRVGDPLEGKPVPNQELDEQIAVEKGEETKTYQFTLFFHQKGQRQAAIVFKTLRQKADLAETTKSLDMSLKTLEIGPDASAKKQIYDRTRPKT